MEKFAPICLLSWRRRSLPLLHARPIQAAMTRIVMKKTCCKIVMFSILILSAGIAGCNTKMPTAKDESSLLAETAKLLDVEFPADAKILSLEKNDRAGEAANFLSYIHRSLFNAICSPDLKNQRKIHLNV